MKPSATIYDFVMRGLLTEEALDRAGRKRSSLAGYSDAQVAADLSLDVLDAQFVDEARKMAEVYTAMAAWENSVRQLVSKVMLEQKGPNWWPSCVSQNIRTRAQGRQDSEENVRWHSPRGTEPLNYTDLGDLEKIIKNNWQYFEAFFSSIEWMANMFIVVERSRNVIMHSGTLEREDIQRLGIHMRDWVKQVGA